MSGILANSTSKTMLAGATSADNAQSGYVALEDITLSVTPTASSYAWAIAKPSNSTARAVLSSTTDASPSFTPDVEGFYTLTCVVDSVTTYVLRVAVLAIGSVSTLSAVKLLPIANVQVPTPATGRTIFSSSDLNDLAQKLPDGVTYAIVGGGGGSGSGYYASIAALKAVTTTLVATLDDGVSVAYVAPLRSWFVWDATSTVADDTTDFLSVALTNNGASAGRFRRLPDAHPAWRLQAAWFVSTAGSNENDGLTSLTPVKTDAEIARRWGARAELAQPTVVTYLNSATTPCNLRAQIMAGGSLTLTGVKSTAKTGLFSAVTSITNSNPWRVTGTGLGAADIGKIIQITASTTPNHIGAYAVVLKDLGSGQVATSGFGFPTIAGNPFMVIVPSVGDSFEVIDLPTVPLGDLQVSVGSSLAPVASPLQNAFVIDLIALACTAQKGRLTTSCATYLERVTYSNITFAAPIRPAPGTNDPLCWFCGGGIVGPCEAQECGLALASTGILSSFGILTGALVSTGGRVTVQSPGSIVLSDGATMLSGGTFFFDIVGDALVVNYGATWRNNSTQPDAGTGNTGYGVVVRAGASYVYQTKPVINSGLGVGREASVGGTDKLYAAVPYVEPANGGALVVDVTTDGPAVFYSSYANVAALKAITAARLAGLQNGQRVFVTTLRAWFAWDATSVVADDTTDFLSVAVTANGASAGRFRRLDDAHPAWLEQATWFVDTAGSNENSGLTALLPVKTDAEIQRRWGLGNRARISTAVSITYAQSPTTQTNFLLEMASNGFLRFVGTPVVTKAGTVLTAIQSQVRTAGAELGWAITGTGLGAADVAVITASGTGANVGAYAMILKDETGGKVRVSPFGTYSESTVAFTQVTPQVGDTIEVRAPTTLNVGLLDMNGLATDTAGTPANCRVTFDGVTLDGTSNGFGSMATRGSLFCYLVRSIVNTVQVAGGGLGTFILRGGGVGTGGVIIRGAGAITLTQVGCLGPVNGIVTCSISISADTYFQNTSLTIQRGGVASTSGAAFFDRSTSNSALSIAAGGLCIQTGATPDWGTANAGHGVSIQSVGEYSYATKPTVNSGLGAGREAIVGGTDKLYSTVPFVEPANNAALVLTA
jgi:hypothetical protein